MDEIKRILVFRTDRLGDFIISKSVLNNLIQYKKFSIDIVVSKKTMIILKILKF